MKKTYNLDNLTYGFNINFRKWEFRSGAHSLIVTCNGQETAHKVARIVNGSIKRCGWVDNLARKNIEQVCR
jgi:hypothetical protein